LSNIFVIGEGNKPLVSLPKGKGVKLSIAGAYFTSYIPAVYFTLISNATSLHLQRSETNDEGSEPLTLKKWKRGVVAKGGLCSTFRQSLDIFVSDMFHRSWESSAFGVRFSMISQRGLYRGGRGPVAF
jgi:hypothetical protein